MMSKKSELVRGYGLAMSIGAAMDEIRRKLGVSEEEFHVLGTPEGRPHLERMITGLKVPAAESKIYLRRLYADETITLDPTNGTRTIAQATKVFVWGIDSDFKHWNLDVSSRSTALAKVSVHELVENGTFEEIYGSLGRPFDELCLTQDQIIGFCVKHKDKLQRDGYGTFFLFQVDGKFFVALVYVRSDGYLNVYAFHFSDGCVWFALYRLRFVIPQLEPLVALSS